MNLSFMKPCSSKIPYRLRNSCSIKLTRAIYECISSLALSQSISYGRILVVLPVGMAASCIKPRDLSSISSLISSSTSTSCP